MRYGIEFNDSNKESFKMSIIYSLNADLLELKSKINFELLEAYTDGVLKRELNGVNPYDRFFNIIIVKLSKSSELFNKYASNITGMKHDEYILKMRNLIRKKPEICFDYAINNIDLLDYKNELESLIASSYANYLIKSKMVHLVQQKWFIKYIIHAFSSESNYFPNVVGYSFSYYLKKRNKNLNFKLIKNHDFFLYRKYPVINSNDSDIYINLGLYKVICDIKGFEAGLLYLLNSCFKSLSRALKHNKDFSITYDDEMYRFIKEEIIYKEDSNYYNKNMSYFDRNMDINNSTYKMINELLSNPLFNNLNIEKYNDAEFNQYRNSSKYYSIDDYIDKLIYSVPSLLDDYPVLKMEYDSSGKRKSLKDLIAVKIKKLNMFYDDINNFKSMINSDIDESIKGNILSKLKKLESGIEGIIRCHNKMIYKSIKSMPTGDFKAILKTLNPSEVNHALEAVRQEKETFIRKLQNNRTRIYKPSVFLENDEFLSKEYILASNLERIIIEKEN